MELEMSSVLLVVVTLSSCRILLISALGDVAVVATEGRRLILVEIYKSWGRDCKKLMSMVRTSQQHTFGTYHK